MNSPKRKKMTNPDRYDEVSYAGSLYEHEHRRSRFLEVCGLAGVFGVAAAVITDLLGALVVDGYSMISQSISSLAVGRFAWIQDSGLYAMAIGTIALAVGLARWRLKDSKGLLGALALLLIGIDIFVIGYFNEYAGQQNRGADIHINAVYALGILFALATFLLGASLRWVNRSWAAASMLLGALWIVTVPFFFFVPSNWFGLYERGLGLILVCWIGAMGWLLWRGRRRVPI